MEENQPPRLTKKQEIFASEVAKTDDPTKSALKAFDTESPEVARVIAHEYLQKPTIIQAIESKRKSLKQALIDNGVTEDKIAKKVDLLLEATDDDGKPDYVAIDKGIKHAATFHGVTDPETDRPRVHNTYNIVFSAPVQERIRTVEAEIKGLLTKPPNAQTN